MVLAPVHLIPAVKPECVAKQLVLPWNALKVCPEICIKHRVNKTRLLQQILLIRGMRLKLDRCGQGWDWSLPPSGGAELSMIDGPIVRYTNNHT